MAFIRDTWVPNLKSDIKHSLKDVGKGWFNLNETNCQVTSTQADRVSSVTAVFVAVQVYEYSKLRRFLTMVNIMMEDTLRFTTEVHTESC